MAIAAIQNNEINLENYLKTSDRTDINLKSMKSNHECICALNTTNQTHSKSSLRRSKHVTFLERVKYIYFDTDKPVKIPKQQFKLIAIENGHEIHADDVVKTRIGGVLENVSISNFRVNDDQSIRLEGHILINNLAYEKKVTIRYTFDDWKEYKDITGFYVNSVTNNRDRFAFIIKINVGTEFKDEENLKIKFEFAIKFEFNSGDTNTNNNINNVYWDNNEGKNYQYKIFRGNNG